MEVPIGFRLYFAMICVVVSTISCKAARPERVLANDAGQACNLDPERICVSVRPGGQAEGYGVSFYTGGGYEERPQDRRCLADWAKNNNVVLQTGPIAPCRTESEMNIADAAASACGVPVQTLAVERERQSWWRFWQHSPTTTISRLRLPDRNAAACLQNWAAARGYNYLEYEQFY